MKFDVNQSRNKTVYKLTIKPLDMIYIDLDKADRKLLDEYNKDDAPISDKLRALELLVSRIERSAHAIDYASKRISNAQN